MPNKESNKMTKFVHLFYKRSLCPEYGVQTWRGNWRYSCIVLPPTDYLY